MTTHYSVRALIMGTFVVPGPEVYWMHAWGTREKMHTLMYVLQGGGKTVLINSGPPADLTRINDAWRGFFGYDEAIIERAEDERPLAALAKLGIRPEDVDAVVVTPLQAYATGNLHRFPKARICISRKGWIEDFQAPYYHLHVPRDLRIPVEVNRWLQEEGWDQVHLLADDEEILPGLRATWAGVHHRSSLAVHVATARGRVVITDCFFKFGNVERNHYLGVMESMMEADATWKRLRAESDHLVSIYDPEIFERYPGGIVAPAAAEPAASARARG
jgi:glyoxylase-like metal-dependent hydrolase (beta-lactamase superfamily II)